MRFAADEVLYWRLHTVVTFGNNPTQIRTVLNLQGLEPTVPLMNLDEHEITVFPSECCGMPQFIN